MRESSLCWLLSFAGLLAACGDAPLPTISVSATPTSLRSGEQVSLAIAVTDFELVDPASTHHGTLRAALRPSHEGHGASSEPSADRGHYHVYLDTTEENPIYMGFIPNPKVTVTASVGAHRLIVRLQDEAHRIVTPEVKADVSVTIVP